MAMAEEKTNRIAVLSTRMLSANLLTLLALSCASLGLWRMGTDLGWAGDFVFQSGFLSHWQVWIGAAIGVQYASGRLTPSDLRQYPGSTSFDAQLLKAAGQAPKVKLRSWL